MRKELVLFFLLFVSAVAFAQKQTVTGTVTDVTKEPMIGATIIEVGNPSNGTIADINGHFSLSIEQGGSVEVSFIGFVVQKLVGTSTPMMVVLKEDAAMLDDVVVTGYTGTQIRSRSTNSIAKVDSKKLESGVYSNPAQALSGAVSGLRVIQSSGNPGATPTIILRGGTNLDGSGSPLVIVDGQVRSSLSDINPEDIADMQVMKDAGATAIYGARANNGVILITTKRGKSGKSEINFKGKVGVNYLNNSYDFVDARTYLTWMRQAYVKSATMWYKEDGTAVGYSNLTGLTGAQPYGTGNAYFASDGVTPLVNSSNSIWSTMYLNDQNRFLLNQGWQQMKDPIYDFMKGRDPNAGEYLIFKNTDPSKYNFNNPSYSQDYNLIV